MDINLIDIDNVVNDNYRNIIELIIDAVGAYPLINLSDLSIYLEEVKKTIKSEYITINLLTDYLNVNHVFTEEQFWVEVSLSSLTESLKLIEFHNTSFSDVLEEMKRVAYIG